MSRHLACSGLPKCSLIRSLLLDVADQHSSQITNPQLKERVSAFGSGLIRYAGLVPQESNVLLLLNDSLGTCTFPYISTRVLKRFLVRISHQRPCTGLSLNPVFHHHLPVPSHSSIRIPPTYCSHHERPPPPSPPRTDLRRERKRTPHCYCRRRLRSQYSH